MSSSPAFASTPNAGTPGKLTAANTATDGTGTVLDAFTAGSLGAWIDRIIAAHLGTNVQTVVRVFDNNGSSPAVAGNNSLIGEFTIAANTLVQTAAQVVTPCVLNYPLKAGHKLLVSIGTAVAAGLQFTPVGGDY